MKWKPKLMSKQDYNKKGKKRTTMNNNLSRANPKKLCRRLLAIELKIVAMNGLRLNQRSI